MSKIQFINRHKHEFSGYVFDALSTNARGALLSETMRLIMNKIDTELGKCWEELQPKDNANENNIPKIAGRIPE